MSMTVGRTEEISLGPKKEGSEGDMKKPLMFTALSTIAVQSGQTQIVVSLLKSGSSVHLQLLRVEPGLCEIGSDQEENQTLIREQERLLEKLRKHEGEVLSSVDKKRAEQRRQKKDGRSCDQLGAHSQEDQEGVYGAMEISLREAWALLLQLLDRRLRTLRLTSHFYHTVKKFSLGIERLEGLKIKPGRLGDAQLEYISIRKDLLGKSLQLLGISSDLVKELRELQNSEALRRQGEVLQVENDEDRESLQSSWGTVLRLERILEALQDRRRAADLDVKLQIEGSQNNTQTCLSGRGSVEGQEWNLEKILAQDFCFTHEAESDLQVKSEEGTSLELTLESSGPMGANDDRLISNPSLESVSSNESLKLQTELKSPEEQQLRVESRHEYRELTPTYGFEETQEFPDEGTYGRSLESLTGDKEEDVELKEWLRFKAEPETELQFLKYDSVELCSQTSLNIDALSDQAEQVPDEKDETLQVKSPLNDDINQESGTKVEQCQRSLPVFNLTSLQTQSALREMKDLTLTTDDLSIRPDLKQTFEDNSREKSQHDFEIQAKSGGVAEDLENENDHKGKTEKNSDTKANSPLRHSIELHNASGLNEINDSNIELHLNTPIDAVTNINQSTNVNMTAITASMQRLPAKLEHCARSLPIFNPISKKLQPKLRDTKALINITSSDTAASLEEMSDHKHQEILNVQFRTSNQCDSHETIEAANVAFVVGETEVENGPVCSDGSEIEESNELLPNPTINVKTNSGMLPDEATEDSTNENSVSVTSRPPEQTLTAHQESEQHAPTITNESFSERFKRLQSKWLEKEHALEPQSEPGKVKKENAPVRNSKEHLNEISVSEELTQWEIKDTVVIQYQTEDAYCDELSKEHLVHKTESCSSVEETTTEEENEMDHASPEPQNEGAGSLRHEEIERLRALCDQLDNKVSVWLDRSTCQLSIGCNPGRCLSEAQHSLNLNIQLQTEAQVIGEDAQSMIQILDQLQALSQDLDAPTHQFETGTTEVYSEICGLNSEVTAQVKATMEHLNTVNITIQSNLQLLQPYATFLQAAEEMKEELACLKQVYSDKPVMEEAVEETRWQTAQQKFLMTQELGNYFNRGQWKGPEASLHPESVVHVVMEAMEHLDRTKEEVEQLHKHNQIQMQKLRDDKEYCRRYRERLEKTVKDLQSVSELLDSCTVIDLGSEQSTSRLLQQFTLAGPHFTQLDAEANFITANFETLRRLRKRHGLLITENVTEEDVSTLLDLHLRLKQKIEESESILELSSSFHLIIQQMEDLLQAKPITDQETCPEEKLNLLKVKKEQIHNLFNRASNLKKDICDGVNNSSVSGLRVQHLGVCVRSMDSQRASWLHEAAQFEEKVLREMKTQALLRDIHLLRDSFKDVKKRFSSLKINYLKRNDRSRNIKAVKNQLQQVDSYEDKLQSLKSRLQALTTRLQSEVKDGGSARELEDLLNELHRQMGECDRCIKEHHKTLDMTCSLQEAMDEYQLWCEEASGTITRVGKFSTECRSTEAVAVLYRQFEKFVWPTVPQQEERISQITELAIRLHGADEGQRYIEKTVSKHSEMVTAIRALSDGLLELEAKFKLENLKRQQKDEEQVKTKRGQMDWSHKETDAANGMKDEERSKDKEDGDNRTAQEAAEMYELKETGHTPELTNKHDAKEIPTRRHSLSKRPPRHKSRALEIDRQSSSSFCSTHTFSMSCSPLETNRQVYAIISQSQQAVPEASPIQAPPPREAHRAKGEGTFNTAQDSGAGSLCETELHNQSEVLSEDSLSTDEYECPSPDDISLPPLAETPESILVQSDLEETVCFSSQHSYRSHIQSEHRESSETNQHNVSRLRTESGTFVSSTLAMANPTQLRAELMTPAHTITSEATTITPDRSDHDNIPEQPSRCTQPISPLLNHKDVNPSLNINFPGLSSNFSEELPHLILENSLPNSFQIHCRNSFHQEIPTFDMTILSSTENESGNCKTAHFDSLPVNIVADTKVLETEGGPATISHANNDHKDFSKALEHHLPSVHVKTEKADNESFTLSVNCQQKEMVFCKEDFNKCDQGLCSTQMNPAETSFKVAGSNSCTTTIVKEIVFAQSSVTSTSLEKHSLNTVTLHQNETGVRDQDPQNQDIALHEPSKGCENEMAQQNNHVREASSSNSSTKPLSQLDSSPTKESAEANNLDRSHDPTSSTKNTTGIKQNHQTIHETSTGPYVHDPGFSTEHHPSPLPEAKAQALAQPANMHVTPSYTSPHLLTPDEDPDICHPCTIREEIRLTPQIKGPSMPPQAQEECSCFTRPVSKAVVVGGSPVVLEVEVMAQPEPTLTWCKDDLEEEEQVRERCEEGKAMDRAACESWLAAAGTKENKNNDEGEDRGLVAEMYDIIMADWQTWFGTLCFLLWLLLLIII